MHRMWLFYLYLKQHAAGIFHNTETTMWLRGNRVPRRRHRALVSYEDDPLLAVERAVLLHIDRRVLLLRAIVHQRHRVVNIGSNDPVDGFEGQQLLIPQ
jgi:hypothetical protein